MERLGFRRELLSSRVGDLSGGQRRRLQLLLVLLAEPNVLLLDEPTNDVDTDTLAAMEDLLDSWPGTLVVVSHDRYLLERVTDQQYAILDGRLRHLPGGVEEYLRLRAQPTTAEPADSSPSPAASAGSGGAEPAPLSGAELRAARKELAAAERRMARLHGDTDTLHEQMAAHDPSDYAGLAELTDRLRAVETETADVEERWLELSEQVG